MIIEPSPHPAVPNFPLCDFFGAGAAAAGAAAGAAGAASASAVPATNKAPRAAIQIAFRIRPSFEGSDEN
jgi:hypothetical protein